MKPLFSNKNKTANTIILHKNNRIIKDNKKISHMNKYFTSLTKTLKLKKTSALKKKSSKHLLRHFKNHFINKIKKHFNSNERYAFREFKETEIMKTIKKLPKKQSQYIQRHFSENHGELGSYLFSGTHKHFQRYCKKW